MGKEQYAISIADINNRNYQTTYGIELSWYVFCQDKHLFEDVVYLCKADCIARLYIIAPNPSIFKDNQAIVSRNS